MQNEMSDKPSFDPAKCNACGLCAEVCRRGGFTIAQGKIVTGDFAECDWCQECDLICPTGAITFPFEVVIEDQD